MNRIIVLASHNEHKVQEMRALCAPHGVEVRSLAQMGILDPIEETGNTLTDNALQKARAVHALLPDMEVVADDTGLEVDALGGAPGVHTARFAGPECNPDDNIDLLLSRLQGAEDRSAHFITVIAHIAPDGTERTFTGRVEGTIATERLGAGGFGYDPVFVAAEAAPLSFAQMAPEAKNAISHRGRATAQFIDYLQNNI